MGETKGDHQDVDADAVGSILAQAGFPLSTLVAVQGVIRTHVYACDRVGSEALYLYDVDALDGLGDIGVARLFSLEDPAGGQPTRRNGASALQKYLKQGPSRVLSTAGHARFLNALRGEPDARKAL